MSEKPPQNIESDFNEEPGQEKIIQEQPRTTEHLITESGRINTERILELEKEFRAAVKKLNEGQYNPEDSESYYEAVSDMDSKFNEAANVLLNTLDVVNNPQVTSIVFHNLKRLLREASDNPSEFFSLQPVYDRIIRNFPQIEDCLEDRRMNPLESIVLMSKAGNDEQKMSAIGFLVTHLPVIERHLMTDIPSPYTKDVESVSTALLAILEDGSEQARDHVVDIVRGLLFDSSTVAEGAEILGDMYDYKKSSSKIMQRAGNILFAVLRHYNIDEISADEWTKEWTRSHKTEAIFVRKNLEAAIQLETKQPGLAKFLSEKCGITAFGRYPVEMLIEQRENMENKERPYGIVLYPKDDWNGAFHADVEVFQTLRRRLKEDPKLKDFLIRIYECGSKKDIAKALIDLDQTYRDSHKISFAIIGGHGTKDSINFGGESSPRNKLYSKDLHRSRVQKTGDFFEPEAVIVLVSCSTGQNEGIGQILSEKFGMKVIAPTVPTNIRRILPKFVNGKIDIDVEYSKKNTEAVYAPAKTASIENKSPE